VFSSFLWYNEEMNKTVNTFDILTCGSITLDTFVEPSEMDIVKKEGEEDTMAFEIGQKIRMRTVARHVGGGAANTAVGFSKMGFKTVCLGTIGKDDHGDFIQHQLKSAKVETKFLNIQKDAPSSASIIFMTPDGRRTVFNERTTHGKFDHFPHGVPHTRALYLGHLDEIETGIFDHLQTWKEKNPKSIIAWNPGKTQFSLGLKHFKNILHLIDLLILNVEEAELFAKKQAKEMPTSALKTKPLFPTHRKTIADVRTHAQMFLEAGVKNVFITDGIGGAQYFGVDGTHLYLPAYENVPSISTLGAGDSFSVGVLSAFLHEKDPATQLIWGSANASSVIQQFGAQEGQLTCADMKNMKY